MSLFPVNAMVVHVLISLERPGPLYPAPLVVRGKDTIDFAKVKAPPPQAIPIPQPSRHQVPQQLPSALPPADHFPAMPNPAAAAGGFVPGSHQGWPGHEAQNEVAGNNPLNNPPNSAALDWPGRQAGTVQRWSGHASGVQIYSRQNAAVTFFSKLN